MTAAEYADRESDRRREEAQQEAEERAATGMDRDDRDRRVALRYADRAGHFTPDGLRRLEGVA